jgi:UDP-glucose 4-epimerase
MQLPTVLVTGAGGFLGGTIATALASQRFPLALCGSKLDQRFKFRSAKVFGERLPSRNFQDFLAATQPEWIVHCAGPARVAASFSDPQTDYFNSVSATDCLYRAIERASPTAKVLYLSSAAVYGQPDQLPITDTTPTNPISPYGEHKLLCEQLGRELEVRTQVAVTNLRIFSAYGPGLRKQVLWDLFRKSQGSAEVLLEGTGDETRDLIYSLDVAKLIVNMIRTGQLDTPVLNVASGRSVTIAALAECLLDSIGYQGCLRFSGVRYQGVPQRWSVDAHDCQKLCGGELLQLEAGIANYARWLTHEYGEIQNANRFLADAG